MLTIVPDMWSMTEQINTSSYFHKDKIYTKKVVKQPLKEVGMKWGGKSTKVTIQRDCRKGGEKGYCCNRMMEYSIILNTFSRQ